MKAVAVSALPTVMLAVLAGSAPNPHAARPPVGRPDWTPIECPMEVPARYTIECGMVTVPEDHGRPEGPAIHLAVAVVRCSGAAPASDPLLIINGGPGACAS
ncbi:MAG: hypothetical protein JW929_03460 [Anaerolineales bacterium]|nr:hypothetical protein [Anaerolineales bacterium]